MNKSRKLRIPLCKCGCGGYVKWKTLKKKWNKFIRKHHMRGKNHPQYGKDRYAKEKKQTSTIM